MKYLSVKITCTLIFLFCNQVLFSQVSLGIQGGWVASKYSLPDKAPVAALDYKSGFTIGGIINYQLTDLFNLRAELRYVQMGQLEKVELPSFNEKNKINTNYLELPIYLVAEFNKNPVRPFVFGGINFGYFLNASSAETINGEEKYYDISSNYKNFDIALDLGMGLKYKIYKDASLLLNADYSYGIYNISAVGGSVYNRSFNIITGILFNM